MIELNSYRHLFLYAKGWYKKNDIIEDLKKILSKRSNIEIKYISIQDIILVLKNATNPHTTFEKFINKLQQMIRFSNINGNNERLDINNLLIVSMLSELSLTNVKDIEGDLGEPDSKILPLSHPVKKFKQMKETKPCVVVKN